MLLECLYIAIAIHHSCPAACLERFLVAIPRALVLRLRLLSQAGLTRSDAVPGRQGGSLQVPRAWFLVWPRTRAQQVRCAANYISFGEHAAGGDRPCYRNI